MLPMVVGWFSSSIGSGQLISRNGRYKVYPILGAAIVLVALLVLSRLDVESSYWHVALGAYLFGTGLGMTLQTIVVAVQNAVEMRDLGAATSSTTFFRSLGGAIGAALFGAVLGIRLDHYLDKAFGGNAAGAAVDANNIQAMQELAEPNRHLVLGSFTNAVDDVFLVCIPFIAVALFVALFLEERPLRGGPTAPAQDDEQSAASQVLSVGH
jgi:MFS family permease